MLVSGIDFVHEGVGYLMLSSALTLPWSSTMTARYLFLYPNAGVNNTWALTAIVIMNG